MKISFLVVKNINRGGGIEKYTHELGSRLVSRGHQVTVYSMGHYGNTPIEFNGMRVIEVPSLPFRYTEKLTASFTSTIYSIFKKKPDVVHLHSVVPGFFAWMLPFRSSTCVLQMHGIEWKRSRWGHFGSRVLRTLEKNALRQTRICTAVSKIQCDYLAHEYDMEVKYIPTGAQVKSKVPAREILKLGLKPNSYILFASRLVREKGPHYLISAFKQLNTDCKLVIAGDANGEKQYKKELQKLAANDSRIMFLGHVQGRLLDELFSNARVYVHPSEVEGLSIALLEAMSFANLALVSDIPENLEAIGNTGVSFKNKNITDLREKLLWCLEHPQQTISIGQNARERVKQYYSWDHITDQFEKLYFDISSNAHLIDASPVAV